MEDYFNEIDKIYHPADIEKVKNIRERLVYLRKHRTKFGPEKVEIETIDSPFDQKLGVVFQKGLEVSISLTKSEIAVNVVKPVKGYNYEAFEQSILDNLQYL